MLTPSAVYVDEHSQVLVGTPALARMQLDPRRGAAVFKRDMGTDKRFSLGNREFTAIELSSFVLASLKEDAEAALGCPVVEAVAIVPAYFGELQRRATQEACALAGLHVERIVNEPTAAALAYSLHERSRELRAVVLDLGGGSFDVTVLEIFEGVVEIQSSAGDTRLGGEDFLDMLVQFACEILKEKHRALLDEPVVQARLRAACERAKRGRSLEPKTALALPGLPTERGPLDVVLELERTAVEARWLPVIDRLRAPIARALRDANVKPEDLDEVLLVGGATRVPQVIRLAADQFSRLPNRKLPPDEMVALGAAVQAALKAQSRVVGDLVVTDIAPFSMGVEVSQGVGAAMVAGIFSPILDRGCVLPVSREHEY